MCTALTILLLTSLSLRHPYTPNFNRTLSVTLCPSLCDATGAGSGLVMKHHEAPCIAGLAVVGSSAVIRRIASLQNSKSQLRRVAAT